MKTQIVVCGYIFYEDKVLLIHHKKLNLWLPVGGHIDEGEIPDEALIREIKEEVGLEVDLPKPSLEGKYVKGLATPFNVNLHSVGDHDHCGLYYICKAKNNNIILNKEELNNFKWFSKEELDKIPIDVKDQCLLAFKLLTDIFPGNDLSKKEI